jgi:hypothetical protein
VIACASCFGVIITQLEDSTRIPPGLDDISVLSQKVDEELTRLAFVIPAEAESMVERSTPHHPWMPACAGMTTLCWSGEYSADL